MKPLYRALALAGLVTARATPALAQDQNQDSFEAFRGGQWSTGGGIGFTAEPDETFLISLKADYRLKGDGLAGRISIGPVMDFGVEDDFLLFLFYGNTKIHWGLDELIGDSEMAKRIEIFGQMGFGLAHIEIDTPFGDFDDQGVLWNFGGGIDYHINDRIALTSNMRFNILGPDLFPDDFTFSWEMIGAKYKF